MLVKRNAENAKTFICKKCNFNCRKQSDYDRHLMTTKHKMLYNAIERKATNATPRVCVCGKEYKHAPSYYRHKKNCSFDYNSRKENAEDKPSVMEIITQNKEIMNLLVLQNEELKRQNKEQSETIRELIPKIGNNNNTTITNTTNNQFNLQTFLNEDCKDALNFSEFIAKIQVSFEDIENQVESGYVKGITKLFLENLQGLGTHKRPIHCTDKKRKTLYIKENDEWDKEGSQDTLLKGIQEITRRTMKILIDEKVIQAEEFADMESEFSKKCLVIQRNLIPTAPRETSFGKIASNISENTIIEENKKTIDKMST